MIPRGLAPRRFIKKDVDFSITNSAISVAKMIAQGDAVVEENLKKYFRAKRKGKGIQEDVELDQDGLIPAPKKTKKEEA